MISPEAHAKLKTEAQSSKIPMSILTETYVDIGIKHGLHKPGWENRLNAALDQADANKFQFLNECPAVVTAKDIKGKFMYECLWYQKNRPPQKKTLGDTEEVARARCTACNKTKSFLEEIDEKDRKIEELEAGLKAKVSEVFKVPKCNAGALLNHDKEDNLIFTSCRKHPSGPVKVDKFCRVYQGGLPCYMFAEVAVGVGAKPEK